MTQKARVIITPTLICSRNCPYCCNHYSGILDAATTIQSIADIPHRDTIMITGGEPMEHIDLTRHVINMARELKFKTIYLYTAKFVEELWDIVKTIDGIHYTLHIGSTMEDVGNFMRMQFLAGDHPDKSFRAYLHPGLEHSVTVTPKVWKRLEVKPWLSEEECPLPEGETLYILEHE